MLDPDNDHDDGPVGFIRPPDELRKKIDRTAMYVAKNGVAFEEKIKNEYRDKQAFGFLFSNDQYNAYYLYKVKDIRRSLLQNLDTKQEQAPISTEQDSISDTFPRPPQQVPSSPPSSRAQDDHDSINTDRDRQDTSHDNGNSVIKNHRDHHEANDYRQDDRDQEHNSESNAPRVRLKLDEHIQEMSMKLEEPPPLNYLATSAPSLTSLDCDIIKLTAQFIAKYGRGFLLELVSREQNNSQFDFLKPQHGQFSYMTNLIMQYALIRNQPLDLMEQLSKDANSQKHVLSKIKMRAEWTKMLELEERKLEEAREKEKILYGQIDWHDFVIVETIDYQPHERGDYPPTTADQVGTRLLMQQRFEEHNLPEEMEVDMDMDDDDS